MRRRREAPVSVFICVEACSMSFWSEASPMVKGAVVFVAVSLLYLGVAKVGNFFPFVEVETTTERGVAQTP